MTSQIPILDPPRYSHPSNSSRQYSPSPKPRTSSPLRAPKLMLVNGMGEISSMPSPIIGGNSDEELSPDEVTGRETSQVLQGLSVPSLFDSPGKQNGGLGRYSPSMSPTRPPMSPPKRSSSPPKTILDTEGKPRPNHRRGHRHKHSLSHQIFLPPPERPPLPLPTNLPIPTLSEILSHAKRTSNYIPPLLAHTFAIIYLLHTSTGEASLTALTFLSLNDLFASLVEALSRTMNAFDVWRTSTLRYPFGLQRLEGLAGFGLGVLGTFNGLYVLKETIEDIIISFGVEEGAYEGSGGHHHHHHYSEADPERVGSGGFDFPVLLLFLTTLSLITTISPYQSQRKTGIRVDYLTLLACVIIFMIPLLGLESLHSSIDRGISLVISFSMIVLGVYTAQAWAAILLCIPSLDEKPLLKQVGVISEITEIKTHNIFQTSHSTGIGIFSLRVAEELSESTQQSVKERIARSLSDWTQRDVKWELYVEFTR